MPDIEDDNYDEADETVPCDSCGEALCSACWMCHYCDEDVDVDCDNPWEDSPFDYNDPLGEDE